MIMNIFRLPSKTVWVPCIFTAEAWVRSQGSVKSVMCKVVCEKLLSEYLGFLVKCQFTGAPYSPINQSVINAV
jgi:hypothetical protein